MVEYTFSHSMHWNGCRASMAFAHHAAVDVLLHLAEGVRRCLALARDDDAHVSDGQRGVHLALRGPAVRDVDALRGVAADVGRPAGGRGLDEVAALLQPLLPLVKHAVGDAGGSGAEKMQLSKTRLSISSSKVKS